MRKSSALTILAILLSGCSSTQPERVYVDLDRAMAGERAPLPSQGKVPEPPPPALPVTVRQPGLPATKTADRTLQRLEAAKQLISENRGRSIASLSAMLKRVYLAQAEDEIAKQQKAVQPEHDSILAAALERLRTAFEGYGRERGPLLVKLNSLAGRADLPDQPIPEHADEVTKANIAKANVVRAQIRSLDAKYDKEAAQLLRDAQKEVEGEIALLEQQARSTRTTAESKAVAEAERQATQTQTTLDIQVKSLVPETLPAVPARQVVVPGSSRMPAPPADKGKPIFGSLEERRRLVEQEIDIWIRSTARIRTLDPKGGRDATEEFLQWRSAHKVGP